MRYDIEDDEEDDEILHMSAKELKQLCRPHQLPLSRKKAVLVTRIVAHLESISDLECDTSLEHLNLILEDDA